MQLIVEALQLIGVLKELSHEVDNKAFPKIVDAYKRLNHAGMFISMLTDYDAKISS